jgi:hypothetical protein
MNSPNPSPWDVSSQRPVWQLPVVRIRRPLSDVQKDASLLTRRDFSGIATSLLNPPSHVRPLRSAEARSLAADTNRLDWRTSPPLATLTEASREIANGKYGNYGNAVVAAFWT